MDKVREELAKYAHNQWTGWMDYLFEKSIDNSDGTVTMPKWAVDRWKVQCKTNYEDLSEKEKDSDRSEADGMMNIFSRDEEIKKLRDYLKEVQDDIQIITIVGIRNIKETLAEALKENE